MRRLCSLLLLLCVGCTSVKAPQNPQPSTTNPPIKKEDVVLSFVAVGDNLIHGAVYHDAYQNGVYDFKPMYQEIKPWIVDKDIAFINQETIIGGKAMGLSHYPQFNSPEEVAEAVVDAGFNVINHASNHSLDKRQLGINNTLETWDAFPEVVVAGINRSQQEQDTIRIIEKQGIKISFLAYTEQTNGLTAPYSYSVNRIEKERIVVDVAKAKEISDIVLVSMHWGSEDTYKANDYQKEYASFLHELGVDVVIGTHPHSIQPVEILKSENHQTLVMYSLGNFLSAQDAEINMLEGMMQWKMKVDLTTKETSFEDVEFIPLVNHFETGFKNFRVYPLKNYTEELSKKHGLQGYKGRSLSIAKFKQKIREVIGNEVHIDM